MKTIRCILCSNEFSDEEIADAKECPSCGTTKVPMLISQDVEVKINWQELRILCIWAMNFADSIENVAPGSRETVRDICGRLSKYRPGDSFPLTMDEEFQEMADTVESDITLFSPRAKKTFSPRRAN